MQPPLLRCISVCSPFYTLQLPYCCSLGLVCVWGELKAVSANGEAQGSLGRNSVLCCSRSLGTGVPGDGQMGGLDFDLLSPP